MSSDHHAPELGDSESILYMAARVALIVAVLGVGADMYTRAGGTHAAEHHGDAGTATPVPLREAVPLPKPTPARSTTQKGAAIAAASPEASEAGLEMIAKGGNAFDAVVAASFAVAVTRPHATGIGGGGFAVYYTDGGKTGALDGRETGPASASPSMYDGEPAAKRAGPRSAGVPGFVALMKELHGEGEHRRGELAWSEVLQPAIRLAGEGFKVDGGLARALLRKLDAIEASPAARAVFLRPDGKPYQEGDVLKQPDLARTLKLIAEQGPAGFYKGDVAEKIAAAAPISKADLAGYKVKPRTPLEGSYRGLRLLTMPPPSAGGVLLLHMLQVLEKLDLRGPWDEQRRAFISRDQAEVQHLVAEALKRAFAQRVENCGDPDFVKIAHESLLTPAHADAVRATIRPEKATPSRELALGGSGAPREREHTTHVSVIDGKGNAVSTTHTINTALGSCFVVPGTGVLLNNEMDDFSDPPGRVNAFGLPQGEKNLPGAGKRPASSMTPLIVIGRYGVEAAIGSPGGPRIVSAVLQVFLNRFELGLDPAEAMRAPRLHHQWSPDMLELELGFDAELAEALARRGHRVRRSPDKVGEVQAVFRVDDIGTLQAVCDPRGTGQPAGR